MSDEEIKDDATPTDDLQAKCDEYLAGWKRALADYDNIKKDLGRERMTLRIDAVANAATQILPVLDNFDVATKFVPENIDDKLRNWVTGILFIRTQLESAITGMGMVAYGEVGEAFDANLHEAAGEREGADAKPNSIVEVVARGWKIGDKIIRPAKVITAK